MLQQQPVGAPNFQLVVFKTAVLVEESLNSHLFTFCMSLTVHVIRMISCPNDIHML